MDISGSSRLLMCTSCCARYSRVVRDSCASVLCGASIKTTTRQAGRPSRDREAEMEGKEEKCRKRKWAGEHDGEALAGRDARRVLVPKPTTACSPAMTRSPRLVFAVPTVGAGLLCWDPGFFKTLAYYWARDELSSALILLGACLFCRRETQRSDSST